MWFLTFLGFLACAINYLDGDRGSASFGFKILKYGLLGGLVWPVVVVLFFRRMWKDRR